jgi:hypothetical protein
MFFGLVVTRKDPVVTIRDGGRIRCPKCGWEPVKEDLWSCNPEGCGHLWNTFETHGVCPGCNRQWEHTSCLRCHQWSKHDDWYAKDDGQ